MGHTHIRTCAYARSLTHSMFVRSLTYSNGYATIVQRERESIDFQFLKCTHFDAASSLARSISLSLCASSFSFELKSSEILTKKSSTAALNVCNVENAYPISRRQRSSCAMRRGWLVGIKYFRANSRLLGRCSLSLSDVKNTVLNVPSPMRR